MPTYKTREEWLNAAVEHLRTWFETQGGYVLPALRVTCGWPSTSGLSAKKRRIGECWAPIASGDGTTEIFISPWLAEPYSEQGVLSTLVHELVHAAVGLEAKHGKKFKDCALKVGLDGKMTATHATETLLTMLRTLPLGVYPHATLDKLQSPTKKQTCRMVKCECPVCGYIVRTTRKWVEEVGAPHCPKHGAMTAEQKETDDTQEDEGGED